MLENAAYQTAGGFQIDISLVVAALVVDCFQIVTVKHADAIRNLAFLGQLVLEGLDILVKSAFIAHGCQRINEHALVQVADQMLLLQDFFLGLDTPQEKD